MLSIATITYTIPSIPSNDEFINMPTSVSIRSYVKEDKGGDGSNKTAWVNKGDIPSSMEINGDGAQESSDLDLEVPTNQVAGPWTSKEKYLGDHYGLLREDAIAPLRDVVYELRNEPNIMEKDSQENASIYEKVCLTTRISLTGA